MPVIHALAVPVDGCTHVEEGQVRIIRDLDVNGEPKIDSFVVELRGGILVDGAFVPQRESGRPTQWEEGGLWVQRGDDPAAREADFIAFCAEFEADPNQPFRSLPNRAVAARLEYLQRVELGLRP